MLLANTCITLAATMGKFQRAQLLARSLKVQRSLLARARFALANGCADHARALLDQWNVQRRAYKLASTWQAL